MLQQPGVRALEEEGGRVGVAKWESGCGHGQLLGLLTGDLPACLPSGNYCLRGRDGINRYS